MSIDISSFYIQNDLPDYQYICFHISIIPQEIIDEYNLSTIMEEDGCCYAEIRKTMYSLKEAGYLSNMELKQILAKEGYVPSKFTPRLSTHKTRDISLFLLLVNDFRVSFTNKADVKHLTKVIEARYLITCNWGPDFYLGMTMKWDCKNRTVSLSMLGYAKEVLLKFQHATGEIKCTSLSPYTPTQYRKKVQMAKNDKSNPMNDKQIKLL